MSVPNNIILYNYAFSPFGRRISAYLALRGIDYALCVRHVPRFPTRTLLTSQEQPFTMPRPDLAMLPVHYRRIPVLAIGRDIYLDTRLILRTLESLPNISSPRLGSTKPQDVFVEKLLERYMIEGPVFAQAAGLVPVDVAQDPKVLKDRQGMLGRTWSREELDEGRGECLTYIKNLYDLVETTILADGREWILGSEGPKLADIEGE
jgi:glutathione S-transferase